MISIGVPYLLIELTIETLLQAEFVVHARYAIDVVVSRPRNMTIWTL